MASRIDLPAGRSKARLRSSGAALDEVRFRRLYEQLAPALLHWARARIRPDVRALIDPQDVVQEVWCRAWSARRRLDLGASSSRYRVFAIARNVLIEATRKARSPVQCAGGGDSFAGRPVLPGERGDRIDSGHRVAQEESRARLAIWVAGLDAQERTLLVRCAIEGLPRAEVACELHISRDAAAKRWQRLRRRLEARRLPRDLLAAPE